ncbi:squalene/phytoene synthase family protein [Commensalibacter sp. Nvir]|uniref:squalene/phytoene synthase family protein n=1 Tax=Commensalibacter sp. Nvir TaxID=3069817 RepID=UPI0030C8BC40
MNYDENSSLSFCAQYVKNHSYDHFLCNIYVPIKYRESIFRLLAFYLELSRCLKISSSWSIAGPMAGLIRLQWWREFIEGKDRPHELAPFIKEELDRGTVRNDLLLSIIEAFEEELEGIADWHQWHSIMTRTRGQIHTIIASILKVENTRQLEALSTLAIACELVFRARYLHQCIQNGGRFFPKSFASRYLFQKSNEFNDHLNDKIFKEMRNILIQKAFIYFNSGSKICNLKQSQISLLLPSLLAKRDLKRIKYWTNLPVQRGFGDQIALLIAFMKHKILAH